MKVIFVFAAFLVSLGLVQGFGLPSFGLPAIPALPIASILPFKPVENPTLATLLKPLNISTGNLFSAPSASAPNASAAPNTSSASNESTAPKSPPTQTAQEPDLTSLFKQALGEILSAKASLERLVADALKEVKVNLLTIVMSTMAKLKELAAAAKPQLAQARAEAAQVAADVREVVESQRPQIEALVAEYKPNIQAIKQGVEEAVKECLVQRVELKSRLACARAEVFKGMKNVVNVAAEARAEVEKIYGEIKEGIRGVLSNIPKDGVLGKILEQLRPLMSQLPKYLS